VTAGTISSHGLGAYSPNGSEGAPTAKPPILFLHGVFGRLALLEPWSAGTSRPGASKYTQPRCPVGTRRGGGAGGEGHPGVLPGGRQRLRPVHRQPSSTAWADFWPRRSPRAAALLAAIAESDMAARSKSCPPVRAAATNPWRAGFLPSERMLREVPLSTLSAVGRLVHPCQRRGGGLSVPLRRRATGPRYGAMDLTADREALPRRASGALQAPARDHRRVGRRRSCTARPRMVDETLNLPD